MEKIKNRACPKCEEVGHDRMKDHLFIMSDELTWMCNRPYHPPYYERDGVEIPFHELGKKPKADDTLGIDVDDLASDSIRGLPKIAVKAFGIKVEFDMSTGKPKRHFYPITTDGGMNTIAYKVRILPKTFSITPKVPKEKRVDLFGMKQSSMRPKTLVLCAGELDAVAAQVMLQDSLPRVQCRSLPFGDLSMQSIIDNMSYIKSADDVIYCPDQDESGEKSVEKISLLVRDIRVAKFSEKDPCAMFESGKAAEFREAVDTAKEYKPSSIVGVKDIVDDAMERIKSGLTYPFERLNDLTYGMRTKGIIGIGAGPGAGKTSFIKAIQAHIIFEHKIPIGIFALEETPSQSLRGLGGYIIKKPVHLPGCDYDELELRKALDSMDGLVHIYDHHGYREWEDIRQTIVYMAHSGVKYVFIDPISALVAHLNASDANTYLNNAMYTLSQLTQSLDITVFHVNHLNNPTTGKDHGAGGKVYGSQFSGSRGMWKFSTDLWGLERNQLAEEEDERNTVKLVIIKNRMSGETGSMHLRYNKSMGRLDEVEVVGSFKDLDEE